MTIVLFSDINFESNAICTIKSLKNKLKNNTRVIYYTIGFNSSFKHRNVITHYIEKNEYYQKYNFYKIELCLKTMELYPDDYYFYTDVDIIFSKKIDFEKLQFDFDYPMASYGPVEFPCTYESDLNGNVNVYTTDNLMKYYNLELQSMRYVWNCIFAFNNKCKEFLEEVNNIFKDDFLMKNHRIYLPYSDETAFNICLWKRNIVNNLGQAFLNTITVDNLIKTEESELVNYGFGSLDQNNFDWEYVTDSKNIIAYHGFKNVDDMEKAANYISAKNVFIIGCFITNETKKSVLLNFINQIKKTGCDIILTSHRPVDAEVLNVVDYFIFDKDNEKMPVENSPIIWVADDKEYINIYAATHAMSIVKNLYNGISLAKTNEYDKFIYMEYDFIIDNSDVYKLSSIFTRLTKENKKLFFFKTPDSGKYMSNCYQTHIFGGDVDYFIKNIKIPKTYEEWIYNSQNLGNHSLEMAVTLICKDFEKDTIQSTTAAEFLNKSNTDVFNIFDNNIIAYNEDNEYEPILFIIPKNNIRYRVVINNQIEFDDIIRDILYKKKLNLNMVEKYEIQIFKNDVRTTHVSIDKNNIHLYKNICLKKSFDKN